MLFPLWVSWVDGLCGLVARDLLVLDVPTLTGADVPKMDPAGMLEGDPRGFGKGLEDVPGESVLFTGLSSDRVGVHSGTHTKRRTREERSVKPPRESFATRIRSSSRRSFVIALLLRRGWGCWVVCPPHVSIIIARSAQCTRNRYPVTVTRPVLSMAQHDNVGRTLDMPEYRSEYKSDLLLE